MNTVTINPEILKTLRKNREIPLESMADKLRISQETYSSYENEAKTISIIEADKIARVFKRNWTVFLLEEPPEKPSFANDNRTSNLQRQGIGIKTYDALEEANFLLNFILSISDEDSGNIPKLKDVSPHELSKKFKKELGLSALEQPRFKSTSEALNYWIDKLERFGINTSRMPLGDDDGVRAFSIYKRGRAIIVLNSQDSDGGKLFSLFHELSHIILRNTGICDLHIGNPTEAYCNEFASEFLISQESFEEFIEYVDPKASIYQQASMLARQFNISKLAAITKFLKNNLLTEKEYEELRENEIKKYKEYQVKKQKKKASGFNPYTLRRARIGRLFTNEIFDALHQSKITPFEASNYVGFSVNKLDTFNEWLIERRST